MIDEDKFNTRFEPLIPYIYLQPPGVWTHTRIVEMSGNVFHLSDCRDRNKEWEVRSGILRKRVADFCKQNTTAEKWCGPVGLLCNVTHFVHVSHRYIDWRIAKP